MVGRRRVRNSSRSRAGSSSGTITVSKTVKVPEKIDKEDREKKRKMRYMFRDNTDHRVPAQNLTKTELLKIIKRMGNRNYWGNLYGYSIRDKNGVAYAVTFTKSGKAKGFEETESF